MLTSDEEDYLSKIDPKKKVFVFPYSPVGREIGEEIVRKVKALFPHLSVLFMGSVALGIAGQKDIDIFILAPKRDFETYVPALENIFGKPKDFGDHTKRTFVEWNFVEEGYDVEVYLTEPPKRHIRIYEILSGSPLLLKEYEVLKMKFNGKSYKDYQRAKYEFFNKILL